MISEYHDAIGHLIVKISTAEILKKIGKLTFWELTLWELTFWEVDILGVDILGVDILGVDILRLTHFVKIPAERLHRHLNYKLDANADRKWGKSEILRTVNG